MVLNARKLRADHSNDELIFVAIEDVTDGKKRHDGEGS
jgi:hypothetical protein